MGRFKPGVSGNPGGRPKREGEVRELARAHTEAAIAKLAELMTNRDPRVALRAAEALLDRAWGRPGQAVELGGGAAIQVEPRPAPAPNGQDADQLAQLLAVLSEAGVLSEALGGGPGPVGRLDE